MIDTSVLDSYRDFMEEDADEFITEILSGFYENSEDLLTTLEESSAQDQRDVFVRAAHSLKSTSATVGATRLSDLSADLEKRGKDEALTDLLPLILALREAYKEAEVELRKLYPY